MAIKYNSDILFLILEELQDDPKTLFSCLMINKLWCEIAVHILWKNPWQYNNITYSNKNSLFNIICFYLPQDIKILLPSHLLFSYQQLSFNYLSFCNCINIEIIKKIISMIKPSLQRKICSFLIRQCTNLKYLNMISIDHQMLSFYLPETKALLESLCELTCDTSTNPSYFCGLAYNCQNIQNLIIINKTHNVNDGVVELIKVQKKLRYFKWTDDFKNEHNITNDPYTKIILALEKKSDMINHLILYFKLLYHEKHKEHMLFRILPKFHKLKTLILNKYCSKNETLLPIYYNLEILHIDYINMNAVINIITNSGGYIKEILPNYNSYYDDDYHYENYTKDTLLLISSIYENCPIIEVLMLVFPSSLEHFVEFEILLRNCQNLKKLNLIIDDNCGNYEQGAENIKEFLKILNRSAPTGLKNIKIFNDSIPYLKSSEILEKSSNIYLGELTDFYC